MASATTAAAGIKSCLVALAVSGCASINANGGTFAGTEWRVSALNGQPTPGGPDYHMHFEDRNWRGGFGCNGMMGEYRIQNGQLAIGRSERDQFYLGRIMATERDCSDRPTGHFEAEAVQILLQPMQMKWRSGRHITLSNSGGSIDAELIG